jgi:type IV pilus assembly protein PilA
MRRRLEHGFTLIELMIVVAIVGILAVLAVYGVHKYIANAKSTEARDSLGQIAKDAAAAVEREKGSHPIVSAGNTSALMRVFCATATPVPSSGKPPVAEKYQSRPSDWSGDATSGWQCLGFSIEEPQYYEYEYTSSNTSALAGGFTAFAHGDLNGDGATSQFSVQGSAQNGAIAISPSIQETSPDE